MIIFEKSRAQRTTKAQAPQSNGMPTEFSADELRQQPALLPEVSELQAVRHFTTLSRKNFCIDTQFYPLGSCTMKYNPRGVHHLASMPAFANCHPLLPEASTQGLLQSFYELQEYLKEVTGMAAVSLAPMAGSQGEFAGVAMMRKYFEANGDHGRTEIIVPDAAHGTNPASAVMAGFKVRELPTLANGETDLDALQSMIGPQTAGIMLTNPSTCGVFMREIAEVSRMIHEVGGLLYYDGANLNAILGKTRPGDMGFDVMHLNLHKTFATPHGGGGPGAGPVAVAERLAPYLPTPMVGKDGDNYYWITQAILPTSIGRLSAFAGNAAILLRAYIYIRLLGHEGLLRVSEFATLNANYIMARLREEGFQLAYPERRASHEFIITFEATKKRYDINAMEIAKRLLDYGMHAPTTYFPLLIPECFLIEPTETECKQDIDAFIEALVRIQGEIESEPDTVRNAPHTLPVKRLDDVKAARELDVVWAEAGA